jgi:ankyrin repeat protein
MTKMEAEFLDAASKGHTRKLKAFLDAGVNVNVQDTRGTPWNRTALMHAAEKGHLKIVDLLLEAGARVDAIDKGIPSDVPGGNTALILAIYGPQADGRPAYPRIAHRLLDAGASPTTRGGGTSVITAAAALGNETLFKRLVALGADVEQQDASGFVPLSSAISQGNLNIVKLLLGRSVDPNSLGPGGSPVLLGAVFASAPRKRLEICKALIEAGADPNRGDENNLTPLMAAAYSIQLKIVKYLLSLGVRVNEIEHKGGRTALDIVYEDLEETLELGDMATPPSRIKALARLLRRAGAKTAVELG